MKTAGVIGGIGPESTIEYYRLIISTYRERQTDGSYPSIIINSIDLTKVLRWAGTNDLEALTEFLLSEIERLAHAGVAFGALASNTPHLVFDELRRRSTIPLISIVEATADAAQALGLQRVGLFGTSFTMNGGFYQSVFSRAGMTIILPTASEQAYIHEKYLSDLVRGIILPDTRTRLLEIVDQMKQRDGIDGLILGGTELPLILRDEAHNGVPFLDTTRIHVERIVTELVS
jgi:aspartate racemase